MKLALRGDDETVRTVVEAAVGSVVALVDADAVLAVDEDAVRSLATDATDVPVVPVGVDGGYHSVQRSELGDAVESLRSGAFQTVEHPILSVRSGGELVGTALFDVTLVTSDAARISEYAVHAESLRIDSFRADGVVVATPLGSSGYARAAGGPVVQPGTGLSLVPISPFATQADVWVLSPPLSLSVERDEGDVSLVLDDDVAGTVTTDTAVEVTSDGSLPLVRLSGLGRPR